MTRPQLEARTEISLLREYVRCQAKLLTAYRLGSATPAKALDRLQAIRGALGYDPAKTAEGGE